MKISDSHPKAEKVYIEPLRGFSVSKKLYIVREITFACQQMALTGIRQRYPKADETEVRLQLGAFWLKKEFMSKVYHWNIDEQRL